MCKVSTLVLTATMFLLLAGPAARPTAAQNKQSGSSMSQPDKARACNDLADKKGLKGDDRKNFLRDCLNKTGATQSLDDMSQRDKLDGCKKLADRKNLKGEDRRSFLKDCMNKVNSR